MNATLTASANFTYADDLTLYVDPLPLSTGGLLQVGGFSNLGALERLAWANGASGLPGTTVIDTQSLANPLAFTGTVSDPQIWFGNGYSPATTSGTWSGSITLVGVNAVPEPTSILLSAAAFGLVGLGYRRRRSSV